MYRLTFLLTALTFIVLPASYSAGQEQGGSPAGPYANTCQDIATSGDTLQARCQDKDGNWRQTSINFRQCAGQIVNDDGQLRCSQQGSGAAGRVPLPGGNYAETCHDIRTNGTVLQAHCQKKDGSFRKTSIDFSQCGGRVVNDGGYLRCGRPAAD